MRRLRLLAVAGLAFCTAACSQHFTRVDFKYSSSSHLSHRESMTTLGGSPDDLVFELSDAFRKQGAQVLQRERLGYVLAENPDAQACWDANRAISQQEFATFSENNYTKYTRIDRTAPYASRQVAPSCKVFKEVPVQDGESWLMMVQFPPRSANTTVYRPTVDSFFMFGGGRAPVQGFGISQAQENVQISVATRLYIWLWRQPGEKTTVYLEGRPVSNQLEAASGNAIGWTWWRQINGYEEADVVRSYILLLQDYDRMRGTSQK